MTFDIGLNEVCVRVGVRYVITKFSGMDSLPNFLTHGAPLRARELRYKEHNLTNSSDVNFCYSTANKYFSDLLLSYLFYRFLTQKIDKFQTQKSLLGRRPTSSIDKTDNR